MPSLEAFARDKLAGLERRDLRRALVPTRRLPGGYVERQGRRLLSVSCNDYLGLTHHPAVIEAAVRANREFGTGAGAARLVTGHSPLVAELEDRLAAFKGAEAALVFSSGYMANVGTIPALVGEGDLILIDERAHACLWSGARMSRARVESFRHNDMVDLAARLEGSPGAHTLIVTEGVFSMDGDIAPLDRIGDLAERHGAWTLLDDAHGLGVVGGGRGAAALFSGARVDVQMGTLSKALASVGGYVCGSRAVIDLLANRARTFVYSTGLPPASAAAALAALDIAERDADLVARPLARARRFAKALHLPEPQSAVVPIVLGRPSTALAAQAVLEEEGFLVAAIRPPTVAEGTSRLRFAFTATIPDSEVDRLATATRHILGTLKEERRCPPSS